LWQNQQIVQHLTGVQAAAAVVAVVDRVVRVVAVQILISPVKVA